MMERFLRVALLLFLISPIAIARDQSYAYVPAANVVIYRDESHLVHRLYLRDLSTGITRVLWEGKGAPYSLKVHRQTGLIGFFEQIGMGTHNFTNKFVILTIRGKLVREFPGRIYDFAFDSQGTQVLYATGREYDNESADLFEPLGVYVADLSTESTKKISDFGHAVAWARFDGNCYVQSYANRQMKVGVFRWEPVTGALVKTEHLGHRFSPTGEYYVKGNAYEDFGLYRADGTRIVIGDLSSGQGYVWHSEVAWSDDSTRLMATLRGQYIGPDGRKTLVYDFSTGRLYRIFAHVLDWGRTSNEVVVEEDGQFVFRTVDSFPQF